MANLGKFALVGVVAVTLSACVEETATQLMSIPEQDWSMHRRDSSHWSGLTRALARVVPKYLTRAKAHWPKASSRRTAWIGFRDCAFGSRVA